MPQVKVIQGDITKFEGDAIVNAANPIMLGGGGVDGAIHRAAGPELREACEKFPVDSKGERCPTGEARVTPGFNLPAKYVIHTVGPDMRVVEVQDEGDALLVTALVHSLFLAVSLGLRTVALPAISCGVYGFDPERAAKLFYEVLVDDTEWFTTLDEVTIALFQEDVYETFKRVFEGDGK